MQKRSLQRLLSQNKGLPHQQYNSIVSKIQIVNNKAWRDEQYKHKQRYPGWTSELSNFRHAQI